ncbi:cyclic AMP-dependent transcription factor ATF-1-like isoform X2 [Rhizophagus irregularis DAOM 181602=DAOM 197198]|nr:cyclic AMP-dependent transcription factor ATF-1-like isoform X2 [Rhizophagus irregularis DAOM 181602=DAOM 197198]
MTHQKKHPGYTVNSITFYNPPYNSQQTTAVNQQHLQQAPLSFPSPQYVSYAPLISSPSSSTAETSIAANLSHQVHSTMQAHPPSTVNLQQLSPQFFHLYPQLVIPSFTPISADVKVAKVISSSSDAPSSTNVKVAKVQVKDVSSSSNTSSSAINNVKVFSSSSNTSSSAINNVKVFSSSSNTLSSIDVKDVNLVLSTDKKIQRLERNRLAARECRERRKAYIINLENRTSKLEDDNLILRYQIQELTTKLELMEYINQDNIRLENEVRELKKRIMGQANKCARVINDDVVIIDDDYDYDDVNIALIFLHNGIIRYYGIIVDINYNPYSCEFKRICLC